MDCWVDARLPSNFCINCHIAVIELSLLVSSYTLFCDGVLITYKAHKMIDKKFIEIRDLTLDELARLIVSFREQRGWTQETLAEFARISMRTVQRVEKGRPSDLDTRRALARAFDWQDIDVFNKPWPFPNEEKIKDENKRLDEATTCVEIETGLSGKRLREMIERSQAVAFHEYIELPDDATAIFAELQDYMKDYVSICSDYSAVDKLNVNTDFQDAIDRLRDLDISLGVGIKQMRFLNESSENKEPLKFSVIYVVAGYSKYFPDSVRIPKQTHFTA